MPSRVDAKRCRHDRSCWIMFGGRLLWCYRCGAIRDMALIGETNRCYPTSQWMKPMGPGGENPWERYDAARERWRKRYAHQD